MFRVVAGAVACVCLVAGGGCGGVSGGASPSSSSAGASQQSSSRQGEEKIASSLEERAKFLLDYEDKEYARSDEQTAMLQRAVDNGGVVSRADYEAAWNNYKQCLVDKGYVAPQPYRFPHGLYAIPGTDNTGLTQEQSDKAKSDAVYCYSVYTMQVNDQYRLQFGNEALTSDDYQAIVDCLHKQGVAPASYTKSQFEADYEKHTESLEGNDSGTDGMDDSSYHVDFTDSIVGECLVANGWDSEVGRVYWKPFG